MRCPTPCEECGEVVELSEMQKTRGGLGAFVCIECWATDEQSEFPDETDDEK